MNKRFIIIGNGVAGISAIEEIRKHDKDSEILLFQGEKKPYYYRASLSEMITQKNTPAMLSGRTNDFYTNLNIIPIEDWVTKIDPDTQIVYTQNSQYNYDELLIATGAKARKIQLSGALDTFVYRNFSDTEQIIAALNTNKRLLIIGGGVLGLELAGAAREVPGTQIAIVQRSNQLGRPILDHPASDWLIQRMQSDGITIFLNDSVKRIEDHTAVLNSGQTWSCDLVVQAIGVEPIFPLVDNLTVGNGIQINANCQTNLPHIYAAGDCTETFHHTQGTWKASRIWLEAAQQGTTAGANMAGVTQSLPDKTFYNASYIYKDHYVIIGEPHGDEGEIHIWKEGNGFRKVRTKKGEILGAMLLNNRKGHLAIRDAINNNTVITKGNLANPDIEWNFAAGKNWDYRFF